MILGRIKLSMLLLLHVFFSIKTYAQLDATPSTNADQLVQEIIGNGAIVVPNTSVLTCPNGAAGTFTDPSSSVGLPGGILLTTGNVDLYESGPNEPAAGQDNGLDQADPALTQMEPEAHYDPCYLEFDIIPICDTLKLDYVFASEEYPDFVCSTFNDAFGFFISGPGIAGPFPNGAENIATIPNTNTYVTINTVNGGAIGIMGMPGGCPNGGLNNTQYFVDNANGTNSEFNGYTVPLTAMSPVTPCETYHMKLIIADAGDGVYDSGVFLAQAGLTCPANTVEWIVDVDNSTEGCSDAVFTLHREGDLTTDLDVVFTFNGTASNGADYTFINNYNFPIGQTDADFTLSALDDNLPEGTESVQIIASVDICGILVGDTLDLQIFDEPFADAGPDQNSCDLNFNLAGNDPAPYTGMWTGPAGVTFSNATSANSSVNLPTEGSYDLIWTVTAFAGCEISDTVNISTSANLNIEISVVAPECFNDPLSLEVTNAVTNAVYTWSLTGNPFTGQLDGAGPVQVPYTNDGSLNVSLNGDLNGCTADTNFTVEVPEILTILAAGFNPTCSNDCNGQATVIPSGGTPNYEYNWTPGGASTPAVNNLCGGDYTITVTDENGCNVDTTFTLIAPDPMIMTYTTINSNCGASDGSGTVNVQGGTLDPGSGYNYEWSQNGNILSTTNQITNVVGSTFNITITDDNDCQLDSIVLIRDNNGFNASLDVLENIACNGECNGLAELSCDGTAPRYDYVWTGPNGYNATGNAMYNLCAGNYQVVVKDVDSDECADTISFEIIEPELLVFQVFSDTTICIDGTADLNAIASGGTSPYSYFWFDGGNITNSQGVQVMPVDTTVYTAFVVDSAGCGSDTLSVTVSVLDSLTLSIYAMDTIVCPGECIDFGTTVAGGLELGYNYDWMSNGNSSVGIFNYCPSGPETIDVVLTDGCETPAVSTSLEVGVHSIYFPDLSFVSGCTTLDTCLYQISGSNFNNILWTNDVTGESFSGDTICFSLSEPGAYGFLADFETTEGCMGTAEFENHVTVFPKPQSQFEFSTDTISIEYNDYEINNLSTGAINYLWVVDSVLTDETAFEPYFSFYEYGWHNVALIAETEFGCLDTSEQQIYVLEDLILYVPNAFTPDGDGINDFFNAKGIGIKPGTFELFIYDRWGNLIFTANDIEDGWNGTVENGPSGKTAQIDVYIWHIRVEDYFGNKTKMVGHVSLIK